MLEKAKKKTFSSEEQETIESLEQKVAANKEALDLLEKELKKDPLLTELESKYGSIVSEEIENEDSETVNIPDRKVYLDFTLDDLEALFDVARESPNFCCDSRIFGVRGAKMEVKVCRPVMCSGIPTTCSTPSLALFKDIERTRHLRKRIDCVICYYSDIKQRESKAYSNLNFAANILPGSPIETWSIPSGIPVSIPLYVLAHFAYTGFFGPLYSFGRQQVNKSQSEIEDELGAMSAKTDGKFGATFSKKYADNPILDAYLYVRPYTKRGLL